jgi:carboxypeptidase Taq
MPTPAEIFAAACEHARRTALLATVDALVGWDERTKMPIRGGSWRAAQAAELAAVIHRQRTDPAQGERLAALAAGPLASGGSPEERASIRLMKHDFDKQARLPPRLVEELARTTVEAQQAWASARAASAWNDLAPWLDKVFGSRPPASGPTSTPTTRCSTITSRGDAGGRLPRGSPT